MKCCMQANIEFKCHFAGGSIVDRDRLLSECIFVRKLRLKTNVKNNCRYFSHLIKPQALVVGSNSMYITCPYTSGLDFVPKKYLYIPYPRNLSGEVSGYMY